MLIDRLDRAPLLEVDARMDGMIYDSIAGTHKPGAILRLWADLRKRVGTIETKQKPGMKFKTRAAEDVIDKVSAAANELGILIYPGAEASKGKGHVVEDGTLAEVELCVIAQAIEDGSKLAFYGFGLGADTQDKAGGKAGTYAFKQAIVQACLAGGSKDKRNRPADTDDEDAPIPGGVKPKTSKPKAPTTDEVTAALEAANTADEYEAAKQLLFRAAPDTQVACKTMAFAARARCIQA